MNGEGRSLALISDVGAKYISHFNEMSQKSKIMKDKIINEHSIYPQNVK